MKVWRDFILEVLRLYFGKIQNKASILLILGGIEALTGGLQLLIASIVAAILDKPISQPQTATWVGFALIALGMVFPAIEVWRDWRKPAEAPNPNDITLRDRFRALLRPQLIRQLRDNSFGVPFRRDLLDPLEEMAVDWLNAEHEFVDPELEAEFAKLKTLNREFMNLVFEHLHVHPKNMDLYTAYIDQDFDRGPSKQTLENIEAINTTSRRLNECIQSFERLAARKIDGRRA